MYLYVAFQSTYHDVTIACCGRMYPAHKLVLCTCSEYFDHIFQSILDQHPVIIINDISIEIMEGLLKYMYLGEVNIDKVQVPQFVSAAECLKIKGLALPDEDPTLLHSTGEKRRHQNSSAMSPPTKQQKIGQKTLEEPQKHFSWPVQLQTDLKVCDCYYFKLCL